MPEPIEYPRCLGKTVYVLANSPGSLTQRCTFRAHAWIGLTYNGIMSRNSRTVSPEPPTRVYWGTEVPMRAIRRFARQVAERFEPDQIILFGSHAYGEPHADSDVDILVIMPTRNQHNQAARIRGAVEAPFPMDLIVRTPKSLAWRLAERESFHTEIMTKGKVL